MAATSVPFEITQGTTVAWSVLLSDYSAASGYTLAYTFFSERQRLTVSGTQSGNGWTVTLSKANTSSLFAGPISWQAFVSDSGATVRYKVAEGVAIVRPDLSVDQPVPLDPRTHARKMLETYNAMLSNLAFVKTLQPEQIGELERVRKQFEWDVKREDDAEKLRAGGYPTRKIFTRFA